MDRYRELRERLQELSRQRGATLLQGIVESVSGCECAVSIGSLVVPGVRLRASSVERAGELIVVPKVGSAVIVGSLSGDLSELAVLSVDAAETVTVNGGGLGGLIKIEELTAKLNALVEAFNKHTHTVAVSHPGGTFTTAKPTSEAKKFARGDYEDEKVRH